MAASKMPPSSPAARFVRGLFFESRIGYNFFDRSGRRRNIPGQQKGEPAANRQNYQHQYDSRVKSHTARRWLHRKSPERRQRSSLCYSHKMAILRESICLWLF